MFVVLENFSKLISETNQLCRNNEKLTENKRAIRKDLNHVVYLRNKVGGHIDEGVLNSVINEEPIIFSSDITPEVECSLASLRVLDMALNNYTDENGKPLIFGHDIDLVYPPDNAEFFDWMENIVMNAMNITAGILLHLNSQIRRVKSNEDLMKQYVEVGLGKFKA